MAASASLTPDVNVSGSAVKTSRAPSGLQVSTMGCWPRMGTVAGSLYSCMNDSIQGYGS